MPFKDVSKAAPGEASATIRQRVIKARDIQAERYRTHKGIHCNAQMTERMIHQYAEPDNTGMDLLRMAMERFSLSARAYSRILKVARTIADLDASDMCVSPSTAEAGSHATSTVAIGRRGSQLEPLRTSIRTCVPPVRPKTLVWGISQRAESLSQLHLNPSKGIQVFILKFQFMLNKLS